MANVGVPVGFWRSVGQSHAAFAVECFVDRLARQLGRDPVEYRRDLLSHLPVYRAVLDLAAERAGWGTPLPEGRARGVAFHESFGSRVAQVAEVSIVGNEIRVHRVTCAVDCGVVVNPDIARAQIEGGILFGLSAALHSEINIDGGRVRQSNFGDYRVLRFPEAPEIDVHFIDRPNSGPGGIGEVGTPPIAPAVANAVFALTGVSVTKLPIKL
jgi:isoquinoline 1-oxidoreductase beta subunit